MDEETLGLNGGNTASRNEFLYDDDDEEEQVIVINTKGNTAAPRPGRSGAGVDTNAFKSGKGGALLDHSEDGESDSQSTSVLD